MATARAEAYARGAMKIPMPLLPCLLLAMTASCHDSSESPTSVSPTSVSPTSVSPTSESPPPSAGAFVLFTNGAIRTDAEAAPVEALLVQEKRVVAAGTEDALRARAAGAELLVVDLGGGIAVPGLVDAHGHFIGYGETLDNVDLVGATSYAEVIERIAVRAAVQEPGTWILGRGWDQTLWEGRDFPHHAALTAAVPEHPVFVRRVDGHAALANARALGIAGLTVPIEDSQIEGGEIHIDENGMPTGTLVDSAMDLVSKHIPAPDRGVIERRILASQDALLAMGLVGVHDMGCSPLELEVLEELDRAGKLRIRLTEYLWANEGLDAALGARFPRAANVDPAGRLRVIGAKLMMDGALGSRGAALLADYDDEAGEHGHLMMEPAAFAALLDTVADAGLQPATHAIGDRANREVLDAYAARAAKDASFRALRPRMEHAQIVAPDDWGRFAALGVIPSMQPTHATSDMRWAERRLGAGRIEGAYAWRHLPGDGAPLAFGSDFPVESPDPRLGLYAARTRQDADGHPPGGWLPGQRVSAASALRGFTTGAAFAAREEEARGRLAPGYFADLTVFDHDVLTCADKDLLTAQVLLTIVDGEVAYRR